jgi:hypothetical protein
MQAGPPQAAQRSDDGAVVTILPSSSYPALLAACFTPDRAVVGAQGGQLDIFVEGQGVYSLSVRGLSRSTLRPRVTGLLGVVGPEVGLGLEWLAEGVLQSGAGLVQVQSTGR